MQIRDLLDPLPDLAHLDPVTQRTWEILNSASRRVAEAIVLTCPLCHFNLDQMQQEQMQKYGDFKSIPIFYFSQLLALALGLDPEVCHFELNYQNPLSLLKDKKLIP